MIEKNQIKIQNLSKSAHETHTHTNINLNAIIFGVDL